MATHIGNRRIQLQGAISDEVTSLSLANSGAITATAQASLPVYDEDGNLLGHIALWDEPTLEAP